MNLYFIEPLKSIKAYSVARKFLASLLLASFLLPTEALFLDVNALSSHRVRVQAPPTFEFINKKGERAIPYLFHSARPFSEGLAPILLGEEWGFIDREGTLKIGARYKLARDFSEGLAPVKIKEDWGYTDTKGSLVIKPRFATAGDFKNGLAVVYVKKGSKEFPKRVQETANKILDKDSGKKMSGASKALLAIVRSRKAGFIDRTGNFVIKPAFTAASPFEDGLALVRDEDKYFFIDKTGKTKLEPDCQRARSFSEGLAAIQLDGKWGYIDKFGKVVIKPELEEAQDFQNGLAAAREGKLWGFIDNRGKWAIKPQFSSVWSGFKSGVAVCARDVSPIKDSFATITKFNSGYVISRRQGATDTFDMSTTPLSPGYFSYPEYRFGLVGKDGSTVAPFNFGEIGELSDGLRTAEIDGAYGYINNIGHVAIKPEYRAATMFSDGLGMVRHGKTTSYKTRRAENLLKHSVPSKVRDPELIRKDIKVADEVIKIDPDNAQAYRDKGYLQCCMEDFDGAVQSFSEVIRLCPISTEGYYWRGNAYLAKKEYGKAGKDFSQAIKLNKSDDRFYAGRARAYLGENKVKYALIDMALALRINSQPYYHSLLARVFKKMGHEKRAISERWRARPSIDMNPWSTWAKSEFDLESKLKRQEEALSKLGTGNDTVAQRALALAELGDSVDTLRRLKFRQERLIEVEPLLEKSFKYRTEALALAKNPSSLAPKNRLNGDLANSIAQLAAWNTRAGNYEKAESLTKQALALAKKTGSAIKQADYLNDYAKLNIEQKNFRDAEARLKESLAISDNTKRTLMKIIRGQTHSVYAVMLRRTGRDAEAEQMLKKATGDLIIGTKLAFLPSPPMADEDASAEQLFALGEQARSMGLIEIAREYWQKSSNKAGSSELSLRAKLYQEVYLPENKTDLETAKHYLTGRTAEVAGDFITAEKIYNDLIEENSKFFWPYIGNSRIYRNFGDYSKAEKSAKKALSVNKKSVEALIELAEINKERGRTSRGISQARKALKIDPDNQMAKLVLKSIESSTTKDDSEG